MPRKKEPILKTIDVNRSTASLALKLERQNAVMESLQHASLEQRSVIESISQSVNSVREEMLALEGKLAAAHECSRYAEQKSAEQQAYLLSEVQAIGTTVKSHAAAIESIRTSMARTNDFMERVIEGLEYLQTMVLDQAGDRVVA